MFVIHSSIWDIPGHILVGLFGDGEDVWVETAHILARVSLDGVNIVDGEILIGINGHQHDTAISVNGVLIDEANGQIVQDGGLVQIRQSREIIFTDQNVRIAQRRESGLFEGHRFFLRVRRKGGMGKVRDEIL